MSDYFKTREWSQAVVKASGPLSLLVSERDRKLASARLDAAVKACSETKVRAESAAKVLVQRFERRARRNAR